jgi:hypothetical protein
MTTTRWDAEEQFDDKESIGIVLFNQHRDPIATFSGIGYQDFANAKLCAAAPDLLAVLQWALKNDDSAILGDKWGNFARAAIAKATGGAT